MKDVNNIFNECYLFVVVICKIKNVMIDMFFASIVLFLVCLDMIGAFVIFSCYIIRYI